MTQFGEKLTMRHIFWHEYNKCNSYIYLDFSNLQII